MCMCQTNDLHASSSMFQKPGGLRMLRKKETTTGLVLLEALRKCFMDEGDEYSSWDLSAVGFFMGHSFDNACDQELDFFLMLCALAIYLK